MQEHSKCELCGAVMMLREERDALVCPYCDNFRYIKIEIKEEPQSPVEPPKVAPQETNLTTTQFEKSATLSKGASKVEGGIIFYDDKMVFKPNDFNLLDAEIIIHYKDICYIETPFSISENSLVVNIGFGDKYYFTVSERDEVAKFLRLNKVVYL